jgi:nitrogen fixation/metabolism regulation signal transduction histidine kinase
VAHNLLYNISMSSWVNRLITEIIQESLKMIKTTYEMMIRVLNEEMVSLTSVLTIKLTKVSYEKEGSLQLQSKYKEARSIVLEARHHACRNSRIKLGPFGAVMFIEAIPGEVGIQRSA